MSVLTIWWSGSADTRAVRLHRTVTLRWPAVRTETKTLDLSLELQKLSLKYLRLPERCGVFRCGANFAKGLGSPIGRGLEASYLLHR